MATKSISSFRINSRKQHNDGGTKINLNKKQQKFKILSNVKTTVKISNRSNDETKNIDEVITNRNDTNKNVTDREFSNKKVTDEQFKCMKLGKKTKNNDFPTTKSNEIIPKVNDIKQSNEAPNPYDSGFFGTHPTNADENAANDELDSNQTNSNDIKVQQPVREKMVSKIQIKERDVFRPQLTQTPKVIRKMEFGIQSNGIAKRWGSIDLENQIDSDEDDSFMSPKLHRANSKIMDNKPSKHHAHEFKRNNWNYASLPVGSRGRSCSAINNYNSTHQNVNTKMTYQNYMKNSHHSPPASQAVRFGRSNSSTGHYDYSPKDVTSPNKAQSMLPTNSFNAATTYNLAKALENAAARRCGRSSLGN